MDVVDCLIIGAGPAGLTAAIYLARFHRKIIVADGGASRASLIPVSHNYPGFPSGINGGHLLARLREQACAYGANIVEGTVTHLQKNDGLFSAQMNNNIIFARKVLLATGVADEHPQLESWREAVCQGKIRLCPICDGYDVVDQHIGLISSSRCSQDHALFLRTYSKNIHLFCPEPQSLDEDTRMRLNEAGVHLCEDLVETITVNEKPRVRTRSGEEYEFDCLYVMLGEAKGSALATAAGAMATAAGQLQVNEHQCTSVDGLYAAGDVANSLHQVGVAIGHAAIAATDIHNKLGRNYR